MLARSGPAPATKARRPGGNGAQATFVPAAGEVPDPVLSVFCSGLPVPPDDPESEPDGLASAPEDFSPADFSLAGEESDEEPFALDPLTAAPLRLSVR